MLPPISGLELQTAGIQIPRKLRRKNFAHVVILGVTGELVSRGRGQVASQSTWMSQEASKWLVTSKWVITPILHL